MITIHHLGRSQSERIVWLCEELGLRYRLVRYERDPVTQLAPPALQAVHPLGAAPVIEDGGLKLAESAAIVEYIIARHGGGRLKLAAEHPDFAQFLYWFHFSNGNLQPAIGRAMFMDRAQLPAGHPVQAAVQGRLARVVEAVETRLGEAPYLAGAAFTAADVMTVVSFTTMRFFLPIDLGPRPNIRAYLQRIGERPAYRRAMAASDPQR
ncbi:glutathione S-transferase [Variovorax sp. TBS-050B]|uniref:glutathione S-transferase family protein n=1 Tax=Variovorax sp. TBS-050B TaxID=2940551 RepID=UPI002475E55E|nr:glutathione S-transferase family protein [Variovorax sp. TBS-050B]MDH6590161.1 glutathione S-transferase [Variovorax sp. TBS-050B]